MGAAFDQVLLQLQLSAGASTAKIIALAECKKGFQVFCKCSQLSTFLRWASEIFLLWEEHVLQYFCQCGLKLAQV